MSWCANTNISVRLLIEKLLKKTHKTIIKRSIRKVCLWWQHIGNCYRKFWNDNDFSFISICTTCFSWMKITYCKQMSNTCLPNWIIMKYDMFHGAGKHALRWKHLLLNAFSSVSIYAYCFRMQMYIKYLCQKCFITSLIISNLILISIHLILIYESCILNDYSGCNFKFPLQKPSSFKRITAIAYE